MGRCCPNCGSSEIDDDNARGDAACMQCGTVIEESAIVVDLTFQENATGGHSLVGQFISRDRAQPTNIPGVPGLGHQESREITYFKGKKLIEEIASQLRINQHCINTAFNFFKMCVSRNFTRGRLRTHVVASCLYMTCRLENTAHLLLDFSDVTQVNLFDLGRTLSFLTRSLRINLPTTDPTLYILRFAVMLDFGEKEKEVVSLATRLVQRMKRDWIATGRRPTGLCGAALLLAARCFNFNRAISDIVKVVHVSKAVVRKRLDEFGQTPSSTLTIDEFATVDLEHCEDPPAFRQSRRKMRNSQLQKEEETLRKMEEEIHPIEQELEKALEKTRKERFKRTPYAKLISGTLSTESEELLPADELVRNEIVDYVFDAASDSQESGAQLCDYGPSLQSLGITDPSKPCYSEPMKSEKENEAEDDDFNDIDDEEINSYILTKEEANIKARFWMKLNGEHMKLMEKRREEREKEKEGSPKKKRRTTKKKEAIVASTAQEAMEKIIQEKKLSNKINYDILKEIGDSDEDLDPHGPKISKNAADNVEDPPADISMDVKEQAPKSSTGENKIELKLKRRRARPNLNRSTTEIQQVTSIDSLTDNQDSLKICKMLERGARPRPALRRKIKMSMISTLAGKLSNETNTSLSSKPTEAASVQSTDLAAQKNAEECNLEKEKSDT